MTATRAAKAGGGQGNWIARARSFLSNKPDTVIGVLIVVVTVFGAYITWRAASASGLGSDLDQRARQERILSERQRGATEHLLSLDQERFRTFEAHVDRAESLEHEAALVEGRDPEFAHILRLDADRERGIARSLSLMFSGYPIDQGKPHFDRHERLRSSLASDSVLQDLRPDRLEAAADDAREQRFLFVVIDTITAGAIFFLTISLLGARPPEGPEARPRVRRHYAYVGAGMFCLAIAAFVVVQLAVEVGPA